MPDDFGAGIVIPSLKSGIWTLLFLTIIGQLLSAHVFLKSLKCVLWIAFGIGLLLTSYSLVFVKVGAAGMQFLLCRGQLNLLICRDLLQRNVP